MSAAWGVERGALWALDLPAPGDRPAPRVDVDYRPAGPADAPALAVAMAVPEAEVRGRMDRGARAHAGLIDGAGGREVAVYGWISEGREHVGELARDFALARGEAYVWDCGTVPAHRGKGLYGGLLRAIADALAAAGRRRCWIGASTTNVASNRTFASCGFRPVLSVVGLRLAGRGVLLRVVIDPAAGPELAAAGRAVVRGR